MSVRSALPWPVRWILGAIMLGFSAAVALWAFEFGKDITGFDGKANEELIALRAEVLALRSDRDKALTISNTSGSLLTAEKAAFEKVVGQVKQLEADNRALRDDLGFFEKLLPAANAGGVAIRSVQADLVSASQLRWQVLVIQPVKDAPDFDGKLEVTLNGTVGGKPWTATLPGGVQLLKFKQYRRIEGVQDLPPLAVVKTVTAKVVEGAATRSVQTFKL
jgi:hypothetical protein